MNTTTLKALLGKNVLSSADKSKINKAYQSHFGRKPSTATNCEGCYHDAVIEIINKLQTGERLKAGEVVEYNGHFYNRHDYPLPDFIVKNHRDKLH